MICSDVEIVVKNYYVWFRPKAIAYGEIREVEQFALETFNGKHRIWGSSDFRHWFNLDRGRAKKSTGFAIDVGKRWIPTITPDDPDAMADLLRSNGARVVQI